MTRLTISCFITILLLLTQVTPSLAQNTGLNFDGTDDHVQTSYQGIIGQGERTVEAMIRTTANCDPNNGGKQKVIVDWGTQNTGQRFTLNVLWNNALRLEMSGYGLSGQTPINDGKWHHVAAVLNPSGKYDLTLYVDGVIDTAGDITLGKWSTGNSVNVRIGRRVDGVNYFDGDIDEVRIFDFARGDSAIKADMNKEYCKMPKGLAAYYKLNDGTPGANNKSKTTAKDHSGGSNNGTLNNFTLTGSSSNWIKADSLTGGDSKTTVQVFDCYSYTSPSGKTYSSPGTYTETLTNQFGCDSIVTLEIDLGRSFNYNQYKACDSFVSPLNKVYHKSGFYRDTMFGANARSCDSIFLMEVLVYEKVKTQEKRKACDSAQVDGKWYFKDANIEVWNTGKTGCDSVHTIDLAMFSSNGSLLQPEECDQYTSSLGNTYSKSGIYYEKFSKANQFGCDSVVTIDLTIHESVYETIPTHACDSFVSPGGQVYRQTGLHKEAYQTSFGCDSVRTYDLVVNEAKATKADLYECDSAQLNGTWYFSSQIVEYKESTNAGCDSMVTINLDITSIDRGVVKNGKTLTANQTGAVYRWYNCDNGKTVVGETSQSFTAPYSGNFAVELSLDGCQTSSECYDLIGLGIDEASWNAIELFPNPNRGVFYLNSANGGLIDSYTILDVSGKMILSKSNLKQSNLKVKHELPPGSYVLQCTSNGMRITQRFTVY
ncbi:MAG: T9SS type A sorting domain-containing protein [Bacteroidia bacterium]|nr:T9SS type A sorting domain-containing protein [Bacteroidia bacterium]